METKPGDPQVPKEKVIVVPRQTHYLRFFLAVIVVGLIAVGFYRGWFAMSSREEPDHKRDVNLTIDTEKIKQDTKKAAEKTKEEAKELSSKVKQEANKLRRQAN